jgi:putative DNA methylase
MADRPDLLIEDWFPFGTVGAESMRERGASSALPPLYFLHVWWARRPLAISRAAIVASVLPKYDVIATNPDLRRHFPTEDTYQRWFVKLMGIQGDPVAVRRVLQDAKEKNLKLGANPYGYPRAFTVNPSPEDVALMREVLAEVWGTPDLTVLDPFSGGGSIPFEARRYGFNAIANELNPVAAVILKATLEYPAQFGEDLVADIRHWGGEWARRVQERLAPYFPKTNPHESIFAYLWARTVACPTTGKPVPLSPNWWLSKDPRVAVRLLADPAWDTPRFEIAHGNAIDFDPDEGTISRGVARSPWTGETVDGDYIKREAQAGRMGEVLYAVAVKRRGGFDFRGPTEEDRASVQAAEAEVAQRRSSWEASNVIPTEDFPGGNDPRPLYYGMPRWSDMFAPRQLLAMAVFVQSLRDLHSEMHAVLDTERSSAVETLFGIAFDKAIDYNVAQTFWDPKRGIRHAFSRHDFAFRPAFTEFDASANLLPWCIDQVASAYRDIARLMPTPSATLDGQQIHLGTMQVTHESATDLGDLSDRSVHAIITDPPYYDNVMYAELADFFYVWLKRTVGHLYPEWFADPLTNKDDEAVANAARFRDLGKKKGDLAEQDYERKMAAAFREMNRVLRDDGVLTVMFTHKRVEAWDTLASALIEAGFCVESSWPVHTESEHSLHQAQKNAAQSTILLTCRKRAAATEPTWWQDLAPEVRRVAREKAAEFASQGIRGVDLYISTFGPALSVISAHWPVLSSEVDERTGRPKVLRPEVALDLAREEVIRLRKQGLLLGREVQFDPVTDWYLMAWDAFAAAQFPADEARKLAIALGLEVEQDLVAHRVVTKKGSDVAILDPKHRRGKGRVDPDATSFAHMLDAVHTAMLIYDEDGGQACGAFLKRAGLAADGRFKAAVQAMLNAIPRTRAKGAFVRPEAATLDGLRLAFFEDLEVPAEPELAPLLEQGRLDLAP